MRGKLLMLCWLAMLSLCSVVVGTMALVDYANAEVIFWTQEPIESESGKIAWIAVSAICFLLFLALAIRERRRMGGPPNG